MKYYNDKDYEIAHQSMLEAYESCCRNCNKKYWEACTGIAMRFGRVEGCNRALEKYSERFDKWTNRRW